MRNVFKDIMSYAVGETAGMSRWKLWLGMAAILGWSFLVIAVEFVIAFVGSGRAIDWAFVLIVTTGILVLVALLGVYLGDKVYHWTKR